MVSSKTPHQTRRTVDGCGDKQHLAEIVPDSSALTNRGHYWRMSTTKQFPTPHEPHQFLPCPWQCPCQPSSILGWCRNMLRMTTEFQATSSPNEVEPQLTTVDSIISHEGDLAFSLKSFDDLKHLVLLRSARKNVVRHERFTKFLLNKLSNK